MATLGAGARRGASRSRLLRNKQKLLTDLDELELTQTQTQGDILNLSKLSAAKELQLSTIRSGSGESESFLGKDSARLKLMLKQKQRNTEFYALQMRKSLPLTQELLEAHPQNLYEQQVSALRARIRQDPQNHYTYSLNYLSQSIAPVDEEEYRR